MTNLLEFCRSKIDELIVRKGFGIDTNAQIDAVDYVVIDTELTGLDVNKDSIVSIGAVRMKGKRIDLGNVFYKVISPSSEMKHKSIIVHGLTPSEVAGKPSTESALYDLIGYCRDAVVVGHFVFIDMDFLNKAVKEIYDTRMRNYVIDTSRIYEWLKANSGEFKRLYGGGQDELNLYQIAKVYGITVSGAHNALNDAFITAQLFQRFLSSLPRLGVRTLRDLLRIGKP